MIILYRGLLTDATRTYCHYHLMIADIFSHANIPDKGQIMNCHAIHVSWSNAFECKGTKYGHHTIFKLF